jgi:hypothetical protein
MLYKTGDVLLFERGSKHGSFYGRLIRLITGTLYTHCALIIMVKDHPYVLEQDGVVTFKPLGTYHPREKVSVWRNNTQTWNQKLAWNIAISNVGQPYGYRNLLECLLSHLAGNLNLNRIPVPIFLDLCETKTTCAGLIANLIRSCVANPPAFSFVSTISEPDDYSANGYKKIADFN